MSYIKQLLVSTPQERMILDTARDLKRGVPLTLDERVFLNQQYDFDNSQNSNSGYFRFSQDSKSHCIKDAQRIQNEIEGRCINLEALKLNAYLSIVLPIIEEMNSLSRLQIGKQ
jgi:hypothetical protein